MTNRVVWREGMALSPHHFQQSELFQDCQARARWRLLSPYNFGFSKLDVETESLELGIFSIRACAGIMPDGAHFSFPNIDTELDSRSFETLFSLEKEKLSVHVGLPNFSRGGPNLAKSPGSGARYTETTKEVTDINTGSNTRPVEFSQLNLRLVFEDEALEGFHTLKAGVLTKDVHGKVILNPDFIPPLLHISGSEVLMSSLKKLIDLCTAKSNYLMAERSQKASGMPRYSEERLNHYILLFTINRSLPGLLHIYQTPHVHPETLFNQLLALYGGLLCFSDEEDVKSIPRYCHQDLASCFIPLFSLIEGILNKTMIMDYLNVPLVKTSPIQSVADFKSINVNAVSQLYLAATAQAPEVEIINTIQRIMKTGPISQIHKLVDAAVSGIELVPQSHPPTTIPVKAGYKYFRFILEGQLWDQFLKEKALAIHMPGKLPGLKLELLALGSGFK